MNRDLFFRFYANLPLGVRHEIILDLGEDGGPITWEVAYREIKTNSDLGKKILEKLIELEFLPINKK